MQLTIPIDVRVVTLDQVDDPEPWEADLSAEQRPACEAKRPRAFLDRQAPQFPLALRHRESCEALANSCRERGIRESAATIRGR